MLKGLTRESITARSPLNELASLYGIQPSYIDSSGARQTASEPAVRAALRALGAAEEGSTTKTIQARRAELAAQTLEPVQVAWNGHLKCITVRLPRSSPHWSGTSRWQIAIALEDGGTLTRFFTGADLATTPDPASALHLTAELPIAAELPSGYHQLRVEAASGRHSMRGDATVIAAPMRCDSPANGGANGAGKSWGAFLPLYALRSRGDWGTGNFASLGRLHEWVREQGGEWTGTLPLLASFLDHPCEPSPYMPVSRLFWNELYIAPEMEPEFAHSAAARRIVASSEWRGAVRDAGRSKLVDYPQAMRLKRRVLEAMAAQLTRGDGPRHTEFLKSLAAHSQLTDYARFRAVQERRGQAWTRWPARMRAGRLTRSDGAPASEHYHQYVQWIAERQLERVGNQPSGQPGRGGLYLDFPLGVHPHGYDVWRHQQLFVRQAATGAPPDELFPAGQNWGFPPLHPDAVRCDGYRYLRDCLRSQMRHARLLRIDHVMGLNRLYWIPDGIAKRDGVYVRYRAEEMYAVLSVESHRAGTIIVGENLGTVPEEVTRSMRRHGVRGMHIMQFSVAPESKSPLVPPPEASVVSLNSHDTPPFAGFLAGRDIADFARLGVFNAERANQQRRRRTAVVDGIRRALGMGAAGGRMDTATRTPASAKLLERFLAWLDRSPAEVVIVNLEDLWGELEPQNIPGTGAGTQNPEQANWRRKASHSLESLLTDKRISAILRRAMRQRNGKPGKRV